MQNEIINYNNFLIKTEKEICEMLMNEINKILTKVTNKIWHAAPVWFLDGNPIVGYSKQKVGIKLLFWSGESFEDEKLINGTGKFKDAGIFYKEIKDIDKTDLENWLIKSQNIQWDYKNIVKRKGELLRLK